MSHSPEPWKYEAWCDGPVQITDSTGKPVVGVVVEFNGFASPIMPQTADLERIVACVNACCGIPTQDLHHIKNLADNWQTIKECVDLMAEARSRESSGH